MEELLQCMICFKNYDNDNTSPRQLPCQHHLCSECLPYMVKPQQGGRSVIECPMCKQQFNMSPDQIPKSRLIMQLLESMKPETGASAPSPPSASKNVSQSTSWSPPGTLHHSKQPVPQQQQQHRRSSLDNSLHQSPTTNSRTYNPQPSSHHQSSPTWNYRTYLKGIFNEMDFNGDGHITAVELQEALKRGQSSSDFDSKTVELLLDKYDTNGDKEISFDEFYDLFLHLNEEFENFLLMDQDGSGAIDARELEQALKKRGYTMLSRSFFDFIVNEIRDKTRREGLLFDHYCRIAARFDYLCQYYRNTPYYQKTPLEVYLRQTFFQNFW